MYPPHTSIWTPNSHTRAHTHAGLSIWTPNGCVAVCCRYCGAVRCGVLQCAAMCCSAEWIVVHIQQAYCSLLQCVAVCCSVMQCVAECCGMLQCVAVCIAEGCGMLQCVAVCCRVLQWRPIAGLINLDTASSF